MIREGRADVVVAGGADAPLSPLVVAGYIRVGALNHDPGDAEPRLAALRPHPRRASSSARGPGCSCWRSASTRSRAAPASTPSSPATAARATRGHPTDPDPTGEGPARAIAEALADAGLTTEDVDYVNAHATSTPAGDLAEARALVRAGLAGATVSSTKSAHGHAPGRRRRASRRSRP